MNSPSREESLFQAALQLDAAECAAFLDRECAGDPVLRKRLEALLAAHDQPETLFGTVAGAPRPTLASDLAGDPADDLIGQTIGRYKLLEQIGEGGCGVVYVAEQTEPVRRRVALKLIKAGMDSKAVIARFEAERQALAMMDHPNIAKFLDAGTTEGGGPKAESRKPKAEASPKAEGSLKVEGSPKPQIANLKSQIPAGRPYFVMELVRGIKITDYCDQHRLSTRERLELFIKVCQAVQHAHQKGIIHRDLKPSNILVTLHDGVPVPKAIDFGIAKATEGRLTDATVYTQLNQFVGTPAYMSPEQAEMSGLDIDTRSDIYSLGVLLYELLTGATPFDAKELMSQGLDAMRRTIREVEPVRPSTRLRQSSLAVASAGTSGFTRHASLPADLDWIVMKCLEKDRGRRYETANGLAADLKRHLNDEPVVACPPSAAYRFQKAWRRNKLAFSAGGAVAAALVLGTMVSLWQANRAIGYGRASRAAEEVARTNAWMAGQARDLATRERERAEDELWKARLSEARALRIAGGAGARVEGAALLRELVKRTNLTEAQVLALRQEAIGQLALVDIGMPTNWVAKPSWHPLAWDTALGRFARAASNRLELCAFPGEQVLASFETPPGAAVEQVQLTPDGKILLARFANPTGQVWAWRVDTREVVLQGHGASGMEASPDSQSVVLLTPRGVVVQPLPNTRPWRVLQAGRLASAAMFSPDMRRLAVLPAGPGNLVEIWDPVTGRTRDSVALDFPPERLAWHPDSTRLALGGDRGRLGLRTVVKSELATADSGMPLPLLGHQEFVDRLRFVPDGSMLASHSWEQSSILWDLVSGRPLVRDQRLALATSSATGDRIVAIQEQPHSESVTSLTARSGYRTVAWARRACEANGVWTSYDGRLGVVNHGSVVSGTDGDSALWDFRKGREIARVRGNWALFSSDSRRLFTFEGYQHQRVLGYDVREEALAAPPPGWQQGELVYSGEPGETISTAALAGDGRTLVVAATDAVIFLDTLGEQPPRRWGKAAHAVSLSPDGRWIATLLHNHLPVIWSTKDGRPAFWAEGYSRIEFSPDNRWFSVATKTELRIHSLDTLQPAYGPIRLEVRGSAPPVAFTPDGRMFAVALNRTHPRLFETTSGRELATLSPPHPAPIQGKESLKFGPNGEWLVAAKSDGETVAWHLPVVRNELRKLHLDWTLTAEPIGDQSVPERGREALDFSGLFTRPARDPATPRELINLDRHYNALLTQHWHPGWGSSDLSELPHGVQTLADVRFDIRGSIQCGSSTRRGEPFPRQVTNIVVGFSARRLHFLHAAIMASGLPADLRIGRYVVRYADGQTQDLPLRVGRELADWWTQDGEDLSRMQVAWTGHSAVSRGAGRMIRLFKTTWENPRPDARIESLDMQATHLEACPFLVAVTAE